MNTPLGTDAKTAYRLSIRSDGAVPVSWMLSTWTILSNKKRSLSDLPNTMRRHDAFIVSDEDLEPLHLTDDELLEETFRLSAQHRAPNADGWHRLSNVSRVAGALRRSDAMAPDGGRKKHYQKSGNFIREHPGTETRTAGDDMLVRLLPASARVKRQPITTLVRRPNDHSTASLPETKSFGEAYRQVHSLTNALVSDGTVVEFRRGEEERAAVYDAAARMWFIDGETVMKRIDPDDPVLHSYPNAHLINGLIAFVSISRTGRVFANIGRPINSGDEEDAYIAISQSREFYTIKSALASLTNIPDLDRVFTSPVHAGPMMAFWLRDMKDAEA